jgi:DNA-directed RNA polymerase
MKRQQHKKGIAMDNNKNEMTLVEQAVNEAKVAQQLALEDLMHGEGVARYEKQLNQQGEENSRPGMRILETAIRPLSKAIDEWTKSKKTVSRLRQAVDIFEKFDSDDLAFITLRRLIAGAGHNERLTTVLVSLGGLVHDELEYRKFKAENPKAFGWTMQNAKKYSDGSIAKYVTLLAKRRAGIADDVWTHEKRVNIGAKLFELAMGSELFAKERKREGTREEAVFLTFTPQIEAYLQRSHEQCALMAPLYLPMVVKPNPWTSPFTGGYYTHRTTLVKTRSLPYLEELANKPEQMANVYKATNLLQDTAYKINPGVLRVLKECWELGGGLAGLPLRDGAELPNKPHDIDTNEVARKAWRKEAALVHEANSHAKSKRTAVAQKLWIAEKFKGEEELYFPHALDWRGRVYPLPAFVNPQGDDSGRGLLMFAEGKPLGEDGVAWLMVHLANCFGFDKASFDERMAWVDENHDRILDSAILPLEGQRFWIDADKPFQFLAACMEYAGYVMTGPDYVSHLPIHVDATCSGIQVFSALLLDPRGAAAVGLTPQERPSDIYTNVARESQMVVERDAAAGVQEAKWFLEEGGVKRAFTKRNTMTKPYSVTAFGMKAQLEKEFADRLPHRPNDEQRRMASYLAKVNDAAIGKVVVAAGGVMSWLQKVAKIAAEQDTPLHWTTPAGLIVQQGYRVQLGKRVAVYFEGRQERFTIAEDSDKLDRRRNANAVAPNFVHALDASILMASVLQCAEVGITNFAAIHDSYATHACDMPELNAALRDAFIDIFKADRLAIFREDIIMHAPEESRASLREKLPQAPARGTFDIELVRESLYFFA